MAGSWNLHGDAIVDQRAERLRAAGRSDIGHVREDTAAGGGGLSLREADELSHRLVFPDHDAVRVQKDHPYRGAGQERLSGGLQKCGGRVTVRRGHLELRRT